MSKKITSPELSQTALPLEFIEVAAPSPATASVVWLHGLGADGHDFVPLVPELRLQANVRFIFPHAPHRAVSLNGGYPMRAWYDIFGLQPGAPQDAAGLAAMDRTLKTLIDHEHARGIPYARVFLAGFSQGGAMALHAGLRFPETLGGIVALSTYLPLHERIALEASAANRATPIFMAHGTQDTVVPYDFGELSCRHLQQLGYTVDWHGYAMAHSVDSDEIADISTWLNTRLAVTR